MATEKKGVLKKVNDWWDGLSFNTQLGITCGVWFIDGLLWGSLISDIKKVKQLKTAEASGAVKGYCLGQIDAYRDIATTNPFNNLKNPTVGKF